MMKTRKAYNHILVALDLSAIDITLIEYASNLADVLGCEKVFFVHNIKKYKISELFAEQLKDVDLDKVVGEELTQKVNSHFTSAVEHEVLISEDPYTESLVQYIVNKYGITLVVLGNKNREKGSGLVSNKLLRMLRCDILTVPRDTTARFDRLWAGVDFSRSSQKVLPLLGYFHEHHGSAATVVHVYEVPIQFSPYVPSHQLGPRIERHTRERFRRFLSRLNLEGKMETRLIPGREAGVGPLILEKAMAEDVNLLLIADKGGNTFSSLVIGSTAEEIFRQDMDLPLWVVK